MDNEELFKALRQGAAQLGIELSEQAGRQLLAFGEELLRWNRKVNLTAITKPREVVDKHLLDSLAILPEVRGARTLLDLGAGAGFPGIPLKVVLPDLDVLLVEAVAKKVGFMKHALAQLHLAGARALQARAGGEPELEHLPRGEVVVSRALMELPEWARLGSRYLLPGGRLLAMTGQAPAASLVEHLRQEGAFQSVRVRRYALPLSGAQRHVLVLQS